jgi:hypothetical protein
VKLGSPTKITVKPQKDGAEFQFLLSFRERSHPIEFHLAAYGAMGLLAALKMQQKRYDLAVPVVGRPKPRLRVVKPDDGE